MEEKFEIIEQKNEVFGTLKVILRENEPWFIGKEVAEKLGYANTKKAIIDHVAKEDKEANSCSGNESLPQEPKRTRIIINESGLYSLIFNSKLESAKKFKRWVTKEVLPSIRKHGMYITEELLKDKEKLEAELSQVYQDYYELEYKNNNNEDKILLLEDKLETATEMQYKFGSKIKAAMNIGFEVTGDVEEVSYLPEVLRRSIIAFINNPENEEHYKRVENKHISMCGELMPNMTGYIFKKTELYRLTGRLVMKKSEIIPLLRRIGAIIDRSNNVFIKETYLMDEAEWEFFTS